MDASPNLLLFSLLRKSTNYPDKNHEPLVLIPNGCSPTCVPLDQECREWAHIQGHLTSFSRTWWCRQGTGDLFSSVTQSCPTLCNPMNHSMPGLPVHHQLPEFPNPCPLSQWCHPAISSSVISFSSCPQSFLAPGSFQMSQLFVSGSQSTEVSATTSVLPMNTQDLSPLGWTGWISLLSKGLSRVFSNTTVQKNQFFGAQPSSQSNSHIHTWPLEKP